VIVIALLGAADLHAWGPAGHEVVVRIALSRMTPEAKAFVLDMLGGEDPVAASNWADQIRRDRPETYNWHFVNIPYGAERYDAARDCRETPAGDCVIAEIARARRVLRDSSRSPAARAESLRFLLHFVGDLHQPLHSIDHDDRGGNDVIVQIDGYTPPSDRPMPPNLHAAWDTILIDARGLDSETYARQLVGRLATEPTVDDGTIDVVAWALEAHDEGVRYAYAFPGFRPEAPAREPVVLDRTYQRAAQAVIDRQLMRAGVRLARILNEAAKTGG
jgi:hypothetical protein